MINVGMALEFLKHRLVARTRHGVHSPFVYRLIDEVIYDYRPKKGYEMIERLRRELLKDERTITVTDLGAGSHINNNKQKKVGAIAKNALKPRALAQLIYRLAADFKPANIVELGTCLGLTTAYLATAAPEARIISVEGCPETASIARENLSKLDITHAEVITGNFDQMLPDIIHELGTLDFVFVDGNHREQATLDYFHWCLPALSENAVMIFDDIYWSEGMKKAWQQIKQHPGVTVTVDLFWIGLVFVRKGQAKEDFKIKI